MVDENTPSTKNKGVSQGISDSKADEVKLKKKQQLSGRRPIFIVILLAIIVSGIYLSWPILMPNLLTLWTGLTLQTIEARKELVQRVAALEAMNANIKHEIFTIKTKLRGITLYVDELSKEVPDPEALPSIHERLSALDKSISGISEIFGVNPVGSIAELKFEVKNLKSKLDLLAGDTLRRENGFSGAEKPITLAMQKKLERISGLAANLAIKNEQLHKMQTETQLKIQQLENKAEESLKAIQQESFDKGLLLAVGQLHQIVLSGDAYASSLAAVRELSGSDRLVKASVAKLAPWSDIGIATPRTLSDRFIAMTRAVLKAEINEKTSFWYRTLHRVTSLVTIRRFGEVDGTEVDAILARAERRLAAGELAAAIHLVKGLNGAQAKAAVDWLKLAEARLIAINTLADLQIRSVSGLAGG